MMKLCDIDHLHKRFLDIWEWCMRQGFDTRAFTYVENAFKSEPIAEQTEPQIFICPIQDNYEALIEYEPQTETKTETQNSNLTFEKSDCSWK